MKALEDIVPSLIPILPSASMQYKPHSPLSVKVLVNQKLVPENYEEDVRHIVLDLSNTNYSYTEGQSVGILPPGTDEKGKPHKLRLYSIASPMGGDPQFPNTVSLCVKRVVYKNEKGETIKGICSNYLCDLKEGEQVQITGPAGKHFSLPQDPETDLIFFATGTGIAPFRSFLFKIFYQGHIHKGNIYLFFGTRYKDDHLYANEINRDLLELQNHQFRIFSALSRENPQKKFYVHHLLEQKQEEVYQILNKDNYMIYICGLKGMENSIALFFKQYFETKYKESFTEEEWNLFLRQMKKNNRWIVETY